MVVFPPLSGVLCPMLQEWLQSWLTVFPMLMFTRMIECRHYVTLKVNGCCTNHYRSINPSFLHHCDYQWKGVRLAIMLFAFTCLITFIPQIKGNPSVIVKNFNFFLFGSYLLKNISQWFNYQFPYFYTWCVNLKVDLIYWWCVACWRTKV